MFAVLVTTESAESAAEARAEINAQDVSFELGPCPAADALTSRSFSLGTDSEEESTLID